MPNQHGNFRLKSDTKVEAAEAALFGNRMLNMFL